MISLAVFVISLRRKFSSSHRMCFVIAFEVFVGNAEQRPARNGLCFCVVVESSTLCFQRKKHFREKSSYGKQTMGRTTTLSSGRGGGQFFSRGALKKFLFCLYLLSAKSQSVKDVLLVCCFVKKKTHKRLCVSCLACCCFLVAFFYISFSSCRFYTRPP